MQRFLSLSLVFFLFAVQTVVAADIRVWTDSTGKHEIKAEFVKLKDDKVTLLNEAGETVKIPLSKLSDDDQDLALELASPTKKSSGATRPKSNNVINSVRGAVYRNQTINNMRQIGLSDSKS